MWDGCGTQQTWNYMLPQASGTQRNYSGIQSLLCQMANQQLTSEGWRSQSSWQLDTLSFSSPRNGAPEFGHEGSALVSMKGGAWLSSQHPFPALGGRENKLGD